MHSMADTQNRVRKEVIPLANEGAILKLTQSYLPNVTLVFDSNAAFISTGALCAKVLRHMHNSYQIPYSGKLCAILNSTNW